MNKPYEIDKDQRLEYLEQANLFKMMTLDLSKELGDFNSSISKLKDPGKIFENCQDRARQMIGFKQIAFFLVNEKDSGFDLYECYPSDIDTSSIEKEIDILVEDGTFSRAVMEREPITAYAKDFDQQMLLHVLATTSRVRGMFVGVLEKKSKHIQEAAFELFSILMAHCANTLESYELYQQLKESNTQLTKKVNQLSQSEFCLKDEILEHKKTEAALESSERQYRLLAETAKEMIFIISREKKISYANSSALEICGYKKAQILDRSILDLIETFDILINDSLNDDPFVQMVTIQSKTGQEIPLEINIALIPNKKSEPGYLLVGRDISKRLELEQDRKTLETKLWQSQKMESIGLLASGIAHDFNNILHVIANYTSLSIAHSQKDDRVFSHLKKVQTASDSAIQLARKLYTIGRSDDHQKVKINIVSTIKETIDLFASSLNENTKVSTQFQHGSLTVLAEETRIQQILLNLITNAGHALADLKGEIVVSASKISFQEEVTMFVMALAPGNYVKISVKDDGPGIDPEIVQQVFDPYFSTKSGKDNSGLGLAVVHGIVKNYKGAIDIQTQLGKGTNFQIYLPEYQS